MRAGDADRRAVVEKLGRHLADGRLSVDEFDERTARAHAAVHLDELPPLLVDLPADAAPSRPAPPQVRRRPQLPSVAVALLVVLVLSWSMVAVVHGAPPLFAFALLFLVLRRRRWSRHW
jgi:hypothetical protein